MRWLILSVPVWALVIGIEFGWQLRSAADDSGIADPIEATFADHLAVQRLARAVLPAKPDHPRAYAVMKWEVPDERDE